MFMLPKVFHLIFRDTSDTDSFLREVAYVRHPFYRIPNGSSNHGLERRLDKSANSTFVNGAMTFVAWGKGIYTVRSQDPNISYS